MSKPIEQIASLTIGTVESVSPSEIKILLEPNAPQATALNTGVPSGFPRINGYILIPNETGALVGLIVWLGVERSQFPRRTGLKDFGLIDLPFPSRKISLTPLGTLVVEHITEEETSYVLKRGVSAFPSVGDVAQLPTAAQLQSIVQAASEEDKRVRIGTSPLAANADVTVDPDKVFGRHIAVLGNTGSGKSCSVAGLIRWSLEAAREQRPNHDSPNARFIILDPNGEYIHAFEDYKSVRRFRVSSALKKDENPLLVPAWMWNSQEWAAFAHAAPAIQRPLLLKALRNMRAGAELLESTERQANLILRSYRTMIENRIAQGTSGYAEWPASEEVGNKLVNLSEDASTHADRVSGELSAAMRDLASSATQTADDRRWVSKDGRKTGFNDFSETDLRDILSAIDNALSKLPERDESTAVSEDAPIEFSLQSLPDHLDTIAGETPGGQAAQFLATLTLRIRMMLADSRLGPVVNPSEKSITFEKWLEEYIGSDQASNGELAIIDLSLVSSDVLHLVIAVVSRIIFEATQRYRKLYAKELPTVIVLEEAHTFVKRGSDDAMGNPTAEQMCRQTFERIAREGRKFGLGLVLASQRPSELSQTVLAQCNTFLLHRIVNDRDQELVARLVPDNLGGLLKELPSLPSQSAILLGWAIPVPTLVEVRTLPEKHRPRSADPKFWDVWTGKAERKIDWKKIGRDWTGSTSSEGTTDGDKGQDEAAEDD